MNTFLIHNSCDDQEAFHSNANSFMGKSSTYGNGETDDKSLASTASLSTMHTTSEEDELSSDRVWTSSACGRHVVRFDDDSNIYIESPLVYEEQDWETMWYQVSDYQSFRADASVVARMIHKEAPLTIIRVLEEVYKDCGRRPIMLPGQDQEDEKVNNDGVALPVRNRKQRRALCQLRELHCGLASIYCVGLESRLSRIITQDRRICRMELTQILSTPLFWKKDTESDQEVLRLQCEKITHRSRLFARLLAQAQVESDLF